MINKWLAFIKIHHEKVIDNKVHNELLFEKYFFKLIIKVLSNILNFFQYFTTESSKLSIFTDVNVVRKNLFKLCSCFLFHLKSKPHN